MTAFHGQAASHLARRALSHPLACVDRRWRYDIPPTMVMMAPASRRHVALGHGAISAILRCRGSVEVPGSRSACAEEVAVEDRWKEGAAHG